LKNEKNNVKDEIFNDLKELFLWIWKLEDSFPQVCGMLCEGCPHYKYLDGDVYPCKIDEKLDEIGGKLGIEREY
jgi:hypothetical protein